MVVIGVSLFGMTAVSMANPPIVETKTEVRTETIFFKTTEEKDPNLLVTQRKTKVEGVNGEQKVTYKITYTDGKETKKEAQGKPEVIKAAVTKVVLVGTREVVNESINEATPFAKKTEANPNMDKGTTELKRAGVNGQKIVTYEITKDNGKEIGRKAIKEQTTIAPIDEITYYGTKAVPKAGGGGGCDPNYAGACVPIASDVDCGGGSGNGPAYVYGTVRVVGSDIYGLDRDGDGYGCD